eukprot:13888-Heterococcus_DN1.PRE.3
MVGVAHIPRSREKTLASSPQTSSAAVDAGNQLQASGEKEKIKPLVVLAAAVAAIGALCYQSSLLESKLRGLAMLALQPNLCNSNVPGWPILTNGESEPSWVSDEMGWITSVFALGAVAGSLVS